MKRLLLFGISLLIVVSFSCKKKNEDPPPKPYTTFTLSGVTKTYNHSSYFSKNFCSSSTYCTRFYLTGDTTSSETLKIGIPGDPLVGHVYETGEYRFSCFYVNGSGLRYDLATAPFQVTFTRWDGQGGWAKGTFSGWMISEFGDSIQFQNGYFQNTIWTY
jgi:hypothetical protein